MKVFEIKCDVDRFQTLLWDTRHRTEFEFPSFEGKPINKANWPTTEVYSLYPKHPAPDIWALGVASGGFALGPKAFAILEAFVEMAGEVLPHAFERQQLMVVNILECLNCLDDEKSVWRKYPPHIRARVLETPCIRSDRLTSSTLFKCAPEPLRAFCWEDEGDPETEFKACVEANKLTGLTFEEVLVS